MEAKGKTLKTYSNEFENGFFVLEILVLKKIIKYDIIIK